MLRIDDYVKAQLLSKSWNYAEMYNQGGHLIICIIMSCFANRYKAGWGQWLDLLHNSHKYAAEKEEPKIVIPDLLNPSFLRVLHEVEAIYDGSLDYAKGGLYFCDLRNIETEFFKTQIIGRRPKAVDMNSFTVFK